ncbi:MAG: PAS domain-containing protein [Candidatus Omnitrophota bacterium]|nr:PAS domain-containing protein [Candidatus Omnitrophota bacterium]
MEIEPDSSKCKRNPLKNTHNHLSAKGKVAIEHILIAAFLFFVANVITFSYIIYKNYSKHFHVDTKRVLSSIDALKAFEVTEYLITWLAMLSVVIVGMVIWYIWKSQRLRLYKERTIITEEERARLIAILERTSDLIATATPDGRLTYMNAAGRRMVGWGGDEDLDGHNIYETHPAWANKLVRHTGIPEALKNGLWEGESVILNRDRREITVSQIIIAHRSEPGEPQYLSTIMRDITERKRAEEQQYRTLIENLPQKVYLKDRDSVYLSCNDNYAKDLKIRPEECIGKTDYDFFPTYLADKYRKDDKRVIESGKTENFEEEYVVIKDFLRGAERSVINTVKVPVRDKAGNVTGLFGLFWDITARKKAEETQDRIIKLINATPDFVGFADARTYRIQYVNPAGRKMIGIGEDEEIAKLRMFDAHPEWTNKLFRDEIIPTAIRDGAWVGECAFLNRSGREIPVNMVLVAHKSSTGEVEQFATISRDITERMNMESERARVLKWQENVAVLQQSLLAATTLERKLKSITDGVVRIFDADFCRIWLIKPGDQCEKGCIHSEVKEGPHVCRYREKCLHLMASSGRYTHIDGRGHSRIPFGCYKIGLIASGEEHKFLTNDVTNDPRVHNREWARELGLVSFAGYQLKVSEGSVIGVLGLFAKHPITTGEDAMLDNISTTIAFIVQQDAVEAELRKVETTKASAEMKSKFTSMVSHELRSPMAVIKESINIILEGLVGGVTSEQKDILSTAKNNIDRLGRLINNVLDFQKIEAGKMELDIKEHDLNKIVLSTSKEMNILAEQKGLSFTVNVDESIRPIKFDKDKIVQVLTNLLSNAIKFTEKGSVFVSTEREDNMVHIVIQDTGPGIQTDEIPKLFQTFEQLGGGVGKKRGGTGLGLAISKEIIRAHNGKIWAESQFGKSSKFHFTLPIKERRR